MKSLEILRSQLSSGRFVFVCMNPMKAHGLIPQFGGENTMFQCHVCGGGNSRNELVSEVFQIEGKGVLVEGIPACICTRCSEATFSRETTEKIRRIVHGESKPKRSIAMDVFAYV